CPDLKGLKTEVAEFVQFAVTGHFTWARPVRLRKGSTGNRCTAGFRSGVCPLWVIRVGPTQSTASPDVRFSNRPFGVKHLQTIHLCGFDVARGLALLFGMGTKALPSWDSKMRWNNL